MVASYQGECDQTEGIDILELVITAPDSGTIEIGCPDLSYDITVDCRTFNLDNDTQEQFDGMGNPRFGITEQFGPIAVVDFPTGGYTAYCRATCLEVGLP